MLINKNNVRRLLLFKNYFPNALDVFGDLTFWCDIKLQRINYTHTHYILQSVEKKKKKGVHTFTHKNCDSENEIFL